ncbi:2-dehydropantoate 2-reductase [Cordyceps militaris]|uniref:2-dehydropantoate 2-reductase n=1 Tax=Cordyceps militaris TaxID=73501 RepID=A0A2H4SPV2_CORMI|nr:2-dehydropantoate 2-reductase [Cordyceps militaris]
MGSQATAPPPWLSSLLESNNPAPKLYAWTPAHLGLSPASSSAPPADDAARRLYILGLGNLGRLYALYIRSRAHDPPPITLLVHRKELLAQWHASNGIQVTCRDQVHTCKDFAIEWWAEEPPPETDSHAPIREAADGGTIHNLLVTTKAQAALPEVDRMRRYLGAQSAVAFAQNGMSKLWPPHGASYMAARFPSGGSGSSGGGFTPLLCVTNHGLYSTGPFSSVFAAPADAYLGPVVLQDTPAAPAPSAAYLTSQITGTAILNAASFSSLDVWVLQLEKLIVNTCINPLTAILRCKTGGLFVTPDGIPARVMDRLLASSSRILQALVADASSAPILATDAQRRSPAELRAELTARFAQPGLRAMLHRAGIRVKDNKSSMLQDVEAGKPTTEIRDFNGWLVDAAAYLGAESIDVSVHQQVIDLVERRVVMNEEQLAAHFLTDVNAASS